MGQSQKARLHLEKAVVLTRQAFGERHEATAASLRDLARLEVENSPWARQLLTEALDILREVQPKPSIELARTLEQLGPHELDEPAKQARYREALEVYREAGVDSSAETSWVMHNLALSVRYSGGPAGAVPLQRKTLEAQRRDTPGGYDVARTLIDLAYTLNLVGQPGDVESDYRETLSIFRKVTDLSHPEMDECVQRLTEFLSSQGETGKVEAVLLEHYALVKADPHASREVEAKIIRRIVSHYQAQHSDKLTEWRAKLEIAGKAAP